MRYVYYFALALLAASFLMIFSVFMFPSYLDCAAIMARPR